MVDDFMVCVDRLITSSSSSCLNSSSSSINGRRELGVVCDERQSVSYTCKKIVKERKNQSAASVNEDVGEMLNSSKKVKEMVECRICQEEDDFHAMEVPCACNGSLKFAHRKCIQRWCNKKGDITCEICTQVFSPNYSIPTTKSSSDVFTINISQAWGTQMNLHDSRFLVLAASEDQLLQSEYEDYGSITNTCSIICLRSVALFFLIILLIRQALLVMRDSGMIEESSALFNISVLQLAGFCLPFCVMARSCYIQSRRRRQG